ncbi:hypothetical protein N7489_008434 [Penicillium chrysogenum]|uniref:uncharacterized protein n=1 Tax=Penicillium chrysogenum TaxID=5076 RepID=UPI0024DF19D0|nr:uncharacterized protein N7489_008434 [Penicillium chrysogenum]KAJ5227726.1 hypothetical protein N7489_008434 [Penicillium chrysogenum]KAJ6167229.1 hypothetical protein N7497_000072 [Penicillium chrysogenum]
MVLQDKGHHGEDISKLRVSPTLLLSLILLSPTLILRVLAIPLTRRRIILSLNILSILLTLLPRHTATLHLLVLPPTSIV